MVSGQTRAATLSRSDPPYEAKSAPLHAPGGTGKHPLAKSAQTKTRDPKAARFLFVNDRSGEVEANLGVAATTQGRTDDAEAEDHQRPGCRLRSGNDAHVVQRQAERLQTA